jgi:hypothetical protein
MSDNVKGCLSKHRFPAEDGARRRAHAIWFERRVALRVYACTDCGGYHLTSARATAPVGRNFGPPKRPLAERERHGRRRRGKR